MLQFLMDVPVFDVNVLLELIDLRWSQGRLAFVETINTGRRYYWQKLAKVAQA